MKKFLAIFIIILIIAATVSWLVYFFGHANKTTASDMDNVAVAAAVAVQPEPTERIERITIPAGSTYADLMTMSGLSYGTAMAVHDAALELYDLANVRAGRELELVYEKINDNFKELRYQIDTEETLFVRAATSTENGAMWVAERAAIPYEVKVKIYHGQVETSMYAYALENDIDERAIIALADAFQWSIDFAMDPRVGDTFDFAVEERYLDGKYVMPGQLLAGRYVNNGEVFEVYYFEESETNIGFFDTDGNSVQKMFLKAPVAFKYISSGFTTGARYLEAFNISTGHRAIDYAATYGTPIRATGDGTVTFAGWNSQGYGNMVSVRHNGTYSTNYAHMSKVAVKRGNKVKQSDIIGYVGSTGLSTGPHVHYEMVKNGVKINPLNEVLPPGEPIKAENRERFEGEKARLQTLLDL
ncbi:MAG: M23 family metallopeptidase [bacterium]|nr:M23 family metallopeptidase [bacterium]